MADVNTENLLDFSSKKKKKKGKVVVPEVSAPEPGDAPAAATATAAVTPAAEQKPVEQPPTDLPEFAKKKKKKAVTIEDGDRNSAAAASRPSGESATPAQPAAAAASAVNELADKLDDKLGFSQKKKKKPKAFVEEEHKAAAPTIAMTPDSAAPAETAPTATDGSAGADAQLPSGETLNYTYEYLLTRVFALLRDKNPELMSDQKRRLVMVPPCMARVGSKKTQFTNFNTICRSLSRDPAHLSAYLFAELGTTGSLDANGALLIRGKYQSKHMEPVLRNYCRTYVLCSTCQSPETSLCKESRLLFLQCQRCGSRVTRKNVTSGFQAVVGKRSAVRAKAQ
ncbi:eukaryotic translation initiation factor 2 [Sparganum proliferum]